MKKHIALTALLTVVALAGCSNDSDKEAGDDGSASSSTSAAAEAAYEGPTIPDGEYEKLVEAPKRLHVRYKFADGAWTEFHDAGTAGSDLEPGSHGTYAYDDDGNLLLDEPCCGVTVLEWQADGDRLTLTAIGPDEALADPMTKVMRDGDYTKVE